MKDQKDKRSLMESLRVRAETNRGKPEKAPFIYHDDLKARAKKSPPVTRAPIVSSFSSWVYRLSTGAVDLDDSIKQIAEIGEHKMKEQIIRELVGEPITKRDRSAAMKRLIAEDLRLRYEKEGLELVYDGTSSSTAKPFTIADLELDGEPLAAKPDLVFREPSTHDYLVMELKTHYQGLRSQPKPIPPFGWPNLKVQLWCYGMIEWPEARNVILRGYVGIWEGVFGLQNTFYPREPWFRDDPRVHKECLDLFEEFGGRIVGGNTQIN